MTTLSETIAQALPNGQNSPLRSAARVLIATHWFDLKVMNTERWEDLAAIAYTPPPWLQTGEGEAAALSAIAHYQAQLTEYLRRGTVQLATGQRTELIRCRDAHNAKALVAPSPFIRELHHRTAVTYDLAKQAESVSVYATQRRLASMRGIKLTSTAPLRPTTAQYYASAIELASQAPTIVVDRNNRHANDIKALRAYYGLEGNLWVIADPLRPLFRVERDIMQANRRQ